MRKKPVEERRKIAKKAFMDMLDEWIDAGYYATYTFNTENGIICEDVRINKTEKLQVNK